MCGVHVRGVCGLFNVYVCYLTQLKLASGNAHNCNDRSGMNFKRKICIFLMLFSFMVMDDKRIQIS